MEEKKFQIIYWIKVIIISMLSLSSCSNKKIKKVVDDFSNYSCFLTLNIIAQNSNESATIVINNADFYILLSNSLDINDYKNEVYNSICHGTSITVSKKQFIELEPYMLKEMPICEKSEKILETYFKNSSSISGLYSEKRQDIIYCLSKDKIFTYVDDETGFLVVY
ncbi:hypothetical protein [Aureibacter tunicatorum]|uniref:Lipoprotein n=1 Tax=Aureibacter tunicatorum TaxID=866807 RepID=A0AAE3XRM6_9BACT|nr:hypothetical protein [Aureibacter tunicatorum]MDR6241488.1 hypothetical protein [Aureibacter tunicatorum]BDD06669.1 hypothetical protein AUTU_41520 [Aureibacter tunicatorum]